jgi:hypothetical protein
MSNLCRAGGISHGLFSKWKKGERTVAHESRAAMIAAIHKQYEHWRPIVEREAA